MSASIFHLFLKACLYSSQIPQYLHLFFIYSSMPAYFLHWFPNACLLFFTDSSSLDSMLLLFATWCPKLKSRNDCPIRAYRFRLNHSLGKMQTCLEPTFGPLFWCFTSTDRGQFELIKIVCLSMSPSSLSASEKFWTSLQKMGRANSKKYCEGLIVFHSTSRACCGAWSVDLQSSDALGCSIQQQSHNYYNLLKEIVVEIEHIRTVENAWDDT